MWTRRALLAALGLLGVTAVSRSDDLTSLFTSQPNMPAVPMMYRQGVITAWNPVTLENTVRVGRTVLSNLPVLGVAEAASLREGATVGLAVVESTWAIIGRFVIPGTDDAEDAITQVGQRTFTATVLTQESTSSSSYVDLATVGPLVSDVLIPASGKVEVVISAQFTPNSALANCIGSVGVDVSGAATIAADSKQSLLLVVDDPAGIQASRSVLFTGLPAGERCNFKLQYASDGSTLVDFAFRDIIVRAL